MNLHNDRQRFNKAAAWNIKFGKFKGLSLNQAAAKDEGLKYLDWMLGLDDLHDDFREALESFLRYEPVARDLENELASKKSTPPWKSR